MKVFARIALILLILLLIGCAHTTTNTTQNAGKDVFSEIAELAVSEGIQKDGSWESYRHVDNILFAVVKISGAGQAICMYDVSEQMVYIIGYYPGNKDGGEYIVGIIQGGYIVVRESVTKDVAIKIAQAQLDKYKLGKKTTMEEFLAKQKLPKV